MWKCELHRQIEIFSRANRGEGRENWNPIVDLTFGISQADVSVFAIKRFFRQRPRRERFSSFTQCPIKALYNLDAFFDAFLLNLLAAFLGSSSIESVALATYLPSV